MVALVAGTTAVGLYRGADAGAAARAEPSPDQQVLSFNFVAPARAAGEATPLPRTTAFDLVPDPLADDPMLSRQAARFEPTPSPTPLPTPVAPPPPPSEEPLAPAAPPQPQVVVGSGALAWPVAGGSISQYYSAGHLALDIAAPYGTAVVAADAGVVTWAGWRSNGGGYVVAIDHGNGMQTAYNHLGTIAVAPGQAVGAGQTIGGIGCTGMCTGPHVHFEVAVGGALINPLRYL